MKLREELNFFSQEMEKILRWNDHKGSWSDCTRLCLYDKLLYEVFEMFQQLRPDLESEDFIPDPAQVIKECCGIANFAMMIADNQRIKDVTGE